MILSYNYGQDNYFQTLFKDLNTFMSNINDEIGDPFSNELVMEKPNKIPEIDIDSYQSLFEKFEKLKEGLVRIEFIERDDVTSWVDYLTSIHHDDRLHN